MKMMEIHYISVLNYQAIKKKELWDLDVFTCYSFISIWFQILVNSNTSF